MENKQNVNKTHIMILYEKYHKYWVLDLSHAQMMKLLKYGHHN